MQAKIYTTKCQLIGKKITELNKNVKKVTNDVTVKNLINMMWLTIRHEFLA